MQNCDDLWKISRGFNTVLYGKPLQCRTENTSFGRHPQISVDFPNFKTKMCEHLRRKVIEWQKHRPTWRTIRIVLLEKSNRCRFQKIMRRMDRGHIEPHYFVLRCLILAQWSRPGGHQWASKWPAVTWVPWLNWWSPVRSFSADFSPNLRDLGMPYFWTNLIEVFGFEEVGITSLQWIGWVRHWGI